MSLKLAIPKRLEERLKKESEKAEAYRGLSEKYIAEADAFLSKGDYVDASEKLWG